MFIPLPEKLVHGETLFPQVASILAVALRHRRCCCCGDVGSGSGSLLDEERSPSVIPELVRLDRKTIKAARAVVHENKSGTNPKAPFSRHKTVESSGEGLAGTEQNNTWKPKSLLIKKNKTCVYEL